MQITDHLKEVQILLSVACLQKEKEELVRLSWVGAPEPSASISSPPCPPQVLPLWWSLTSFPETLSIS